MQLEKNEKFRKSPICKGLLYFNPYLKIDRVELIGDYSRTVVVGAYQSVMTGFTTEIELLKVGDSDPILIGGQVASYFRGYTDLGDGLWGISVLQPYGTYEMEEVSAGVFNTLNDMEKKYDSAYFFTKYFNTERSGNNCAFIYRPDGSSDQNIGCNTNPEWDDPNILKDVEIIEYEIVRTQATFGHHKKVYQTNNTYKVKLGLPFKTPISKIDQLFNSEAVALQMDDRETTDYANGNSYNFPKQLGGGSISPLIRRLSFVTGSLKMITKRDRYEVTAFLEG